MLHSFIPTVLLGVVLSSTAMAQGTGMVDFPVIAEHQAHPLIGAVWYPAQSGGAPDIYARNPVFQGVEVFRDADLAEGAHPVVMLSHGMGGGVQSVAWMGAALARRGAIVVAVSHPGSSFSDFDMARGVRHWTRAQDLSAALDSVMADPRFAGHMDNQRVMAAGFSFGGWTALSLGGATSDHARFASSCARADTQACRIFLDPVNGLDQIDPAQWAADYHDARVTSVFALDPGFVWGLSPSNTQGLVKAVTLMGLGQDHDRLWDTNFDASGLSSLIDGVRTIQIAPANHFSAMPLCTPAGTDILAEDGDDPVCTDPEGADRTRIHARIIDATAAQIGLD